MRRFASRSAAHGEADCGRGHRPTQRRQSKPGPNDTQDTERFIILSKRGAVSVEQAIGARHPFAGSTPSANTALDRRDEFGAGCGDGFHRIDVGPAKHDARDLDHLGPPAAERQVAMVRLGLCCRSRSGRRTCSRAAPRRVRARRRGVFTPPAPTIILSCMRSIMSASACLAALDMDAVGPTRPAIRESPPTIAATPASWASGTMRSASDWNAASSMA